MDNYKNISVCRLCNSKKLLPVVKIKPQFIASTFVKTNKNNSKSKIKIPMTLLLCKKCGLVQLKETVKPDFLYESYFYRSNVSNTMNQDLRDVVSDVCSRVELKKGDATLDIGCNDGLMITFFPKYLKRFGIDPAKNIDWSHLDKSITIVNDYFPSPKLEKKSFKIITTTAMFYDLDDPNKAVKQIKELLKTDGVLCVQVSYLYDTIRDMNFYDICHEHLEYYSLKTLSYLMEKNGMEIFDASTNFVNGGSIRVMVAPKEAKRKKSRNLEYLLLKEKVLQLESPQTYSIFSKLIELNTDRVTSYIKCQKGLVIGLGASTKGNVMLQLCGIDKKTIPFISERNPFKVGLKTLGTDILLISEEEARKKMPDCMFVIPWNFKNEILDREKKYIEKGGKLLFIMPYPYVIDRQGETKL
ncbi:class I SAM-dependent methyltransferase [Candidatus Microgenomates bacterium]|nr:MAG: class I SAM-dependent methyltransferase [Candidatus Microgenomates bacterium]